MKKQPTIGKEWRRNRTGQGISRRAHARKNPPMKIESDMTNHERLYQRQLERGKMTQSRLRRMQRRGHQINNAG